MEFKFVFEFVYFWDVGMDLDIIVLVDIYVLFCFLIVFGSNIGRFVGNFGVCVLIIFFSYLFVVIVSKINFCKIR